MIHIPRSIPVREATRSIVPNADRLSQAAEGIRMLRAEAVAGAATPDKPDPNSSNQPIPNNKHT